MAGVVPSPAPSQTYVEVSPLAAGHITLPERFFVTDADPQGKRTVPSFSFLISHPTGGTLSSGLGIQQQKPFRLLFDLGLRRALDRYPPPQQEHLRNRQPNDFLEGGFPTALSKRGLGVSDIELVILSHVHYDHHGDPKDFPPPTRFAVGAGALHVVKHGLGGIASHQHFEADLFPDDGRALELPASAPGRQSPDAPVLPLPANSAWKPLGPFAATLDLFGDGSAYVVDAPGHLPGHVNMLVRLREKHWAYLAGDACHDRRILTGERGIGTWKNESGATMCIHLDKEGAERSIRAISEAQKMWAEAGEKLEVVLGHDDIFERENEGRRLWPKNM